MHTLLAPFLLHLYNCFVPKSENNLGSVCRSHFGLFMSCVYVVCHWLFLLVLYIRGHYMLGSWVTGLKCKKVAQVRGEGIQFLPYHIYSLWNASLCTFCIGMCVLELFIYAIKGNFTPKE